MYILCFFVAISAVLVKGEISTVYGGKRKVYIDFSTDRKRIIKMAVACCYCPIDVISLMNMLIYDGINVKKCKIGFLTSQDLLLTVGKI